METNLGEIITHRSRGNVREQLPADIFSVGGCTTSDEPGCTSHATRSNDRGAAGPGCLIVWIRVLLQYFDGAANRGGVNVQQSSDIRRLQALVQIDKKFGFFGGGHLCHAEGTIQEKEMM